MDLQLDGKRALVTGGSAGIGSAIVQRLANENARVIVHGRNQERTDAIVARVHAIGGEAVSVLGELGNDEGALRVFEAAQRAYGGIDILINNAGTYASRSWFETTPENWRGFYEEDTLSAIRLILHVAPSMREAGWGRIINIATGMASTPQVVMADYAAAKAALLNATVSLAKALAGTGVTANTVSPGLIATDGVQQVLRMEAQVRGWGEDWQEIQRRWMAEVLGNRLISRLGTVEEVADLVAFVASPRAGYIQGANLRVDGGLAPSIN